MAFRRLSSHLNARGSDAAPPSSSTLSASGLMHRRPHVGLLVLTLTLTAAPGCSRTPRPETVTTHTRRQNSLGDPGIALGPGDGAGPHHECAGGLTATECVRVDSAITTLQQHPDPQCRAAGDSARARLSRAQLEFIRPALSTMGPPRRPEGRAVTQPGATWVGAEQFDWRASLMDVIAREFTTDSLRRNAVGGKCRH